MTAPRAASPASGRPIEGDLVERAVERWRRFWFEPRPMTTLGLVRIAFGLLMVGWSLSLLPDLLTFFGRDGVRPRPPDVRYTWGLLHVFPSDRAVVVVWVLLAASAVALTLGWHARLAALLVFVAVLSFQRRDIFIFNSGDVVVRVEALYLALAPTGAALSLDRRRTAGSFWDAQVRAPWVLRLMQVQLSVIYLSTAHDKLTGVSWNEGSAVSYALRLTDLQAFALPDWLTTNALLMNVATWSTVLLEISLGVLVWHRRLRPWVLGAGVVMHLIFLFTLAVAFFSFAMFVLYLAFVPAETAQRWVDRVRQRLGRRAAEPDAAGPPPADAAGRQADAAGRQGDAPLRQADDSVADHPAADDPAARDEPGADDAAARDAAGADAQTPTG